MVCFHIYVSGFSPWARTRMIKFDRDIKFQKDIAYVFFYLSSGNQCQFFFLGSNFGLYWICKLYWNRELSYHWVWQIKAISVLISLANTKYLAYQINWFISSTCWRKTLKLGAASIAGSRRGKPYYMNSSREDPSL